MSGYDGIRERIHAALDRDGQHDWDETARLADVIAPVVWNDPDLLDAAWAEAEAALPASDWLLEVVHRGAVKGDINPHTGYPVLAPVLRYTASAAPAWHLLGGIEPPTFDVEGATPAAALRALTAKLRDA